MPGGAGHSIANRYRLLETADEGGFWRVWRAHDQVLDREVAVMEMLLPPQIPAAERAGLAARTIQEARAAARLSKPETITLYDVVEDEGVPWIVMQHAEIELAGRLAGLIIGVLAEEPADGPDAQAARQVLADLLDDATAPATVDERPATPVPAGDDASDDPPADMPDPPADAPEPSAEMAEPPADAPDPSADAPEPPLERPSATTGGSSPRRSRGRRFRRVTLASAGIAVAAITAAVVLITLPGAPRGASTGAPANAAAATATSVAAFGGLNGLIAAARKEGQLNVTGLPANWANYGTLMTNFTAMYGIKITDANPEGTSEGEITAVKQLKGQSSAPDVVDVDSSHAASGAASGIWAPYKVATWNDIPTWARAANGDFYAAYGGYMAIGYDKSVVKVAPTSFKSLLTGPYRNQVAIDGNPTQLGSAFGAVYAAALANGGSLSDIAPGVSYFKKLKAAGNFVPVRGTPGTVMSGQTPILIWWDYLLTSEVKSNVPSFRVVIPADAKFAQYYYQAVSKYAPHPAAARLWEEYLYSVAGQNLFLEGTTRPIEMRTLVSAGTIDTTAAAALPRIPVGDAAGVPTIAQQDTAATIVARQWPSVTG